MARSAELSEFWKHKSNTLKNTCRLCANISDNVVPIFDKLNEKGSIFDKLKRCLPSISVRETDFKPKQVCISCVSKLDSCLSFIQMSLDSDHKFDAMLQSRIFPPWPMRNEYFTQSLANNSDLPWLQVKTEPLWNDVKQDNLTNRKAEQKLHQHSLCNQLNQQKLYPSTQRCILPVSQFKTENNFGSLSNKEDTNHNFIPNYLMPEVKSAQDLIVLVEVENKNNSSLSNDSYSSNEAKKRDHTTLDVPDSCDRIPSINDFASLSSKLIETAVNNYDMGGPTDFDDPQFLLKVLENDLLNALKTENVTENDVSTFGEILREESEKSDHNLSAKNMPGASCNTSVITPADSAKKSLPIRDFSCSICGRTFTRRNRLNAHVARHSSERPHSCDKCDQRFITRWDLTLHLRIHSGIFSCEFCGKAFPAKGKLERHRRTHTGERPFSCTQCTKAFSEKRNLENHLKTHLTANLRSSSSSSSGNNKNSGSNSRSNTNSNVCNNNNTNSCNRNSTASAKTSGLNFPSVGVPSVYLKCGHINSVSSYALRKSCEICDKLAEQAGSSRLCTPIAATALPTTSNVGMTAGHLKPDATCLTTDTVNNNSNNNKKYVSNDELILSNTVRTVR